MRLEAIVAVYADWGIGKAGTQPIVLKADRAHFKRVTEGAAVIVGRRTMQDFPGGKPLKGRENIVISRTATHIDGAELARSTEEALELSEKYDRCLVIGGASVYSQLMKHIDRIYLTRIYLTPDSDSYFENLDASPDWYCTEQSETKEEDGVEYCFCTYERIESSGL